MSYTKVVIIGGGFGGLNVAKYLDEVDCDITIIDRTNHHLFQPLLYQVATAALTASDIAKPIRDIFRDQENCNTIMANVVAIDQAKKHVILENGDEIAYTYLILAPGARHSYFGRPEWEEFAPGLKTLDDALNIRERILMSFEKAERCDSYKEAEKYLNFVIIGGGPTGVEMAGSIAEIAHQTMLKNFARIDPTKTKIYLVESHPHILPPFAESLSIRAEKDLNKLGVQIIPNRRVTKVTKDGVFIDQDFIEARNIIWAAGNEASPLLKTLKEIELDKAGRAVVDQDLSHPKHPEIFIIGDAAYVKDKKGNPLPAISPVAIQAAKHVAKIIKKQTPKEKRKPFKYFDKGTLATIGKYRAVGQIKGLKFKGIVAWFLWSFVHIVYLVGFSNKVVVLLQWMFYFIAGQRNVRVIVHPLPEDKSHKSGVVEEWERKPAPIQKEEHGIDQQNKAQ